MAVSASEEWVAGRRVGDVSGLRVPAGEERPVSRQRVAFDEGMRDAGRALAGWRAGRFREVGAWAIGSLLVGLVLLVTALVVALVVGPGHGHVVPVFADPRADAGDALRIIGKNLLVLLLHCLVCFGTYLAVRSVPLQARRVDGRDRLMREIARPLALACLAGFTAFSLGSQAWRLGHDLAAAAGTLGYTPAALLVRLSVHAVPELTALFLPLAACAALARARRYRDLAAAALLTGAVALPVVVVAACCEVWVTRLVL